MGEQFIEGTESPICQIPALTEHGTIIFRIVPALFIVVTDEVVVIVRVRIPALIDLIEFNRAHHWVPLNCAVNVSHSFRYHSATGFSSRKGKVNIDPMM